MCVEIALPSADSTSKYTGNFLVNVFATKIHGEFHSYIILHTNTITDNLVFYMQFFPATALLVKLPKTSTRGLLSMQQTDGDYYLVDFVGQRDLW